MKIVCYKDKIIKAINSVVKGVTSKTTMPILEGWRFSSYLTNMRASAVGLSSAAVQN